MPSQRKRDAYILDHLSWAESIGRRYSKGTYLSDDLVSAAHFGLIRAATSYISGHAPFRAYARHRIKGAILDCMREQDVLSRGLRAEVKSGKSNFERVNLEDVPHLSTLSTPDSAYQSVYLRARIDAAMASLPARLRQVVRCYYFEGMAMRQLAAIFQVNESRICQLLQEARRIMLPSLIDLYESNS